MEFKKKYSYTKKVVENEIDDLNHVNNIVYLKWVQEVSELHWNLLSNNDLNSKYFWVVLRHEIDYFSSAKLNDSITITTFIGDSYGVKSERFVEIYKEEKLLVKAKTIWCLISKITMKPIRIPEEINAILSEIKI